MNERLVLDASPVILLGKAGLLETVSPLAKIWAIPGAVVEEVEAKRSIHPYLSSLGSHARVERIALSEIHPWIAAWDLGRGESEVLASAIGKTDARVVLDDLRARECAELLGIPFTGSLGLVLLAKRKGVIDAARPSMEKLVEIGLHIDPAVLREIYERIGE